MIRMLRIMKKSTVPKLMKRVEKVNKPRLC